MKSSQSVDKKGFLLIEALTVLFIFSLITVTFYSVLSVGIRYIQDSKNRLGALAIANEKIEIIRNLKYDDIGTSGGAIEGNIPQDENVSENASHYNVHIDVVYVDDPFDGIAFADTVWFEDYKKVTVTVSWGSGENSSKVELVSRFVPPGKEVPHIGDGILSVNIFSNQPGGAGISDAKVQIYNPDTGINTYGMTDASGNVTFMGSNVTDSIQKYQLAITKSGYETVMTMPPYPENLYTPVDIHASVVTGSMNVKDIVQNKLANIEISSVNYLNEAISNANFHLTGGRKLGNMAIDPFTPVYSFDDDITTDSSGKEVLSSVSPGEYNLSLIGSTADDYEIINTAETTPFLLLSSDGTLSVEVKLASKTVTALLATIISDTDDSTISGANVKLTNVTLGYEKDLITDSDGKVFFPDSADPFLPETYHIKVTADGFLDKEVDVAIEVDSLKLEVVRLQPVI
ncbi:MAG: carboxypeptidase-like regulatory domain-containing protein [Candidatus Moraniibacteriota bacterium]